MDNLISVNSAWTHLLSLITMCGEPIGPRGLETKELIAHQSVIPMSRPINTLPARNMNYKFMFGEAWWILSGSNKVEPIAQYLNNIRKFSDNGVTFEGAYGPKVAEQLGYIISTLAADPASRQAVLTIWRERPGPSKDIPCTVSLQFLIRNNRIICNANMRSSDVWLGWAYDVFNFSMISAYIAIALRNMNDAPSKSHSKLELGHLYLTAGSQHLYSNNYEDARKVIDATPAAPICLEMDLDKYLSPEDLIDDLKNAADGNLDRISEFMVQPYIFQDEENYGESDA